MLVETPDPGARAVPLEELKETHFRSKWYLNGFPKSGLHWVALMILPLAEPNVTDHELWATPWTGSFRFNSWSNLQMGLETVTYRIGRLLDGHFLQGHAAHSAELERFLWHLGAATVFVYRDFRDIAVSQAHHVISESPKLGHPGKDLYRSMRGFDEVLEACIVGVDRYPGVMKRWEDYAPWLDVDWVCKIRFEELKADTHEVAKRMIMHGLRRTAGIFGLTPNVEGDGVEKVANVMVQCGQKTEWSVTFRKGAVGDWRAHFAERHKRLFKESDRHGWLERLGYANGASW